MKMKKLNLFWIIPSALLVLTALTVLLGHLFSPVPSKKKLPKNSSNKIWNMLKTISRTLIAVM